MRGEVSGESLARDLEAAGCVSATAWAEPLAGGPGVGFDEEALVTPASVVKVPIALTVLNAVYAGDLDGRTRVRLDAARRTPGPVTVSLMADDVEVSLRDLVTLSLTVSD